MQNDVGVSHQFRPSLLFDGCRELEDVAVRGDGVCPSQLG